MRNRKLSFMTILLNILLKGAKSLQVSLNELAQKQEMELVSASAYSQARQNLSHTAFIELNDIAVSKMYSDDDYLKLNHYRLLAIDGSKIRLPNNPQVQKEFGDVPYTDGKSHQIKGTYCSALSSVLYDVLNRIAIDSILARCDAYEGDLAATHIKNARLSQQDIVLFDRGYPSFKLIAQCHEAGANFIMRCSTHSFSTANMMHEGEKNSSELVELKAGKGVLKLKAEGLETIIKVRFVRVILETGEREVLVTSLLDEDEFPSDDFKGIYWLRWRIETYYGLLKTRLGLENFTGYSVEAIKQDFYSTIYITSLEAILTEQAQRVLDERETKNPIKVNRMVSFNAIKSNIFELLFIKGEKTNLRERLTSIFLTAPICSRNKSHPRRKEFWRKSAEYLKWRKKVCF